MSDSTPRHRLYTPELIAAIATPPGQGGVAIVRLSGEGAIAMAKRLLPTRWQSPDTATDTATGTATDTAAHTATDAAKPEFFYSVLRDPVDGRRLDEAIVLFFVAPHSYTGEEVVEFQVHGGGMPARAVLDALTGLGVRMALPGEFTRRAFLNGRIDLSQAEAVMDLIGAQSSRAAQVAVEQLQGALRRQVDAIYEPLLELAADLEASLDFDEDDVPEMLSSEAAAQRVDALLRAAQQLLSTGREGHLLREGALLVISGSPNAGKSSLFNALLGRPRAIVHDTPGTTRDSLEETLLLGGIPLRLADTAGLRQADDEIERQGVDRATELVARADLHLRVLDLGEPLWENKRSTLLELPPDKTVVALNKCDLFADAAVAVAESLPLDYTCVVVSAKTGEGLDRLREHLRAALGAADFGATDIAVSSRHRDQLVQAEAALRQARQLCEGEDAVLIAQALRDAAIALGVITGRDVGEDLLDQIFARFCVGK